MSEPPTQGFTYWVSDEQIDRFRAASLDEKLAWLDDVRETTWALASPEVRARWRALRAGRAIDDTRDP